MKGYKGMGSDMTCLGFQYEVGKTYTFYGKIELCRKGFHFCKNLKDVFKFYHFSNTNNRFFEVEASGDIIESNHKSVTSQIKIIRELSQIELYRAKYISGYVCGDVSKCGNGYGCGYRYGYENGDDEYGYGNGYIYGNSHKEGYGDGFRYGDGSGNRLGNEYGNGYGDGYNNIQQISKFI